MKNKVQDNKKCIVNVIKFIIFLIYTVGIFYIVDYRILTIIICLNILTMIISKISIKGALKNIAGISIFIAFTVIINISLMGVQEAILVGIRLAIVCNATYIFTKQLSTLEIAETIEALLAPLKLLKINTQNIGIIISIAMAFIPIISKELNNITYSLKSKGFDTRMTNLIVNIKLIMKPLFISILKRVNEVEYALKAKAYVA